MSEVKADGTSCAGTTSGAGECVRRPGRPRDERADRAIVDATLELLVEEGYNALSVEAIAAQAGVSKATIYRRWNGKHELVLDAISALKGAVPPTPVDGTIRERLLQIMRHICRKDPETLEGRLMPRILAYRTSQPELFTAYVERVLDPRRERTRQVLRDGIAGGELRADLDVELTMLALSSPLILLALATTRPVTEQDADGLLDLLWPGLTMPRLPG